MPESGEALLRHSTSAVVYFANCPEHGLHGERDECFVCGKPVDHVAYVRADLHARVRQWRVRWRRNGFAGPSQKTYMSEAKARQWALVVQGRMAEAFPDEDPESCECGGKYCHGPSFECGGTRTKGEKWAERTASLPPLVWGPVLDSRPVGDYEGVEVLAQPAPFPLKPEPVFAGTEEADDDIPW